MQPISIPYAYNVGKLVQQMNQLKPNNKLGVTRWQLASAQNAIYQLLHQSVYRPVLVTCRNAGETFLVAVKALVDDPDDERILDFMAIWQVQNALQQFETVFSAEMDVGAVFLVTPKRGYNIRDLVDHGEVIFPIELLTKVPEAIKDIQSAARCIAFELPTAAAFHMHRANEAVMLKYWDAITNGAARPKNRNIGIFLEKLDKLKKGDAKVKAALRDLKDLHRNPVLHPEDTLETIDEAIALMNNVHTAVVHMLKTMP